MRTIRTPKRRGAFLTAISAGQSVSAACRAAGIARSAVYTWRKDDAEFADAWDEAIEAGTDLLEDIARRRAVAQSDLLLIFLLRARRPHLYSPPRAVQIGGLADAPPVAIRGSGRVTVFLPDNLRDRSIEDLETELAELRARQDATARGNGSAGQ
jgi:transposase-like protein